MCELSVIIPTFNRAHYLDITLDSLLNQTLSYEKFEIIIVDNGSTDNTKEISDSYKTKFSHLKYIYEPKAGLHNARHCGLKNAVSDILVYADDDIKAFPAWLESVMKSFQDENTVLVGGNNFPEFEEQPPDWISGLWEKSYYGKSMGYLSLIEFGNKKKEIPAYYVWGCNFAVRKQIVYDAGGFHPDAFPANYIKFRGDGESTVTNYIMQKKLKTFFVPEASVYHIIPASRLTLDYFKKRSYQQGITDAYRKIRTEYFKKNNLDIDVFKNRISFWKLIKSKQYEIKNKLLSIIFYKESKIKKKIRIAYNEGYNFLKKEAMKSSELLNWIIKPDYFE
ncbi:glycosyltransferase family 2 protein [Candidatus Dependentiae bacterium]|nr:glycosyltransferase family 2 protein [Candidatus Dependentiae bacterium]